MSRPFAQGTAGDWAVSLPTRWGPSTVSMEQLVVSLLGIGIGLLLMVLGGRTMNHAQHAALYNGFSGPVPDTSRAAIGLKHEDERVHVFGLFAGREFPKRRLHYRLKVRKNGEEGRIRTTQVGTFTVTPGRVDTMSTVTVSATAGEELHIQLVVRKNGTQIDRVRTVHSVPERPRRTSVP